MNQSWGFPSQQRFDPFHRQGALAALLCCARQWMKMFRFWLEVREHFCGMRRTVLSSYNIRAFSWFAASLWAPSLNMVFAQNFYAKPTPNSQQKRSFESICAMSGFLGVECAWFFRSRHLAASSDFVTFLLWWMRNSVRRKCHVVMNWTTNMDAVKFLTFCLPPKYSAKIFSV